MFLQILHSFFVRVSILSFSTRLSINKDQLNETHVYLECYMGKKYSRVDSVSFMEGQPLKYLLCPPLNTYSHIVFVSFDDWL